MPCVTMKQSRQSSSELTSEASTSSSSDSDRVKRFAKHRKGYIVGWKKLYPWILAVENKDCPGQVIGLLCELCQRHEVKQ